MIRTQSLAFAVVSLCALCSAAQASAQGAAKESPISMPEPPPGYKVAEKPITAGDQRVGRVVQVAKEGADSKVVVMIEFRDLSQRGPRAAACKAYVNSLATSMKKAGYVVASSKVPDISKIDFSAPVLVDMTFKNDQGSTLLVRKRMFFTSQGFDVSVIAASEADLRVLDDWAAKIRPSEDWAAKIRPSEDSGHQQRKPKVFAIIFNMGYGGDAMPKDKEGFEKMVVACKEANYNVILSRYDATREEICRKHGMLMFVDLLDGTHHVYRDPEWTKKVCENLRGNDTIYGYHLWSDHVGRSSLPGRNRDIANVHEWDPTHPNYVGTYRLGGNSGLENPDLHGYYDFHWQRGRLWVNLNGAWNISRQKDCSLLMYMQSNPGQVGKGNYNRLAYTNSVSITYGLKGMMYHYRGGTYAGNGQWDELGKDLGKTNGDVLPVGPELMKIGNPTDIYSTPMTMDSKNRNPLPGTVPDGFKPVPADYWAQIEAGEVLIGAFKDDQKRDAAVLANHNIYMPQKMKLKVKEGKKVELFDRATKAWKVLAPADGAVTFDIEPGSFELIHVAN